jgi:hypothetical protein
MFWRCHDGGEVRDLSRGTWGSESRCGLAGVYLIGNLRDRCRPTVTMLVEPVIEESNPGSLEGMGVVGQYAIVLALSSYLYSHSDYS